MHQVYYFFSCYNNYDILIGEQLSFLLSVKDQVVILDDHSSEAEQRKGHEFCKEHGLLFVVNKYKGLQMGIKFLSEEILPSANWLVCMQQDTFFCTETTSVEKLNNRLTKITDQNYPIGAVGFQNYVKNSHYNKNAEVRSSFLDLQTWLGVFFLSPKKHFVPKTFFYSVVSKCAQMSLVSKFTKKFRHKIAFKRNFAPLTFDGFSEHSKKYKGVAAIELPVWAAIAINLKTWKEVVKPDPEFVFHLWFPDIAMQFLSHNRYVCIDTEIHVINDVNVKEKYGQLGSVDEGQKKGSSKMEKYGNHLQVFHKKWGFDYEFIYPNSSSVRERYNGTLVGKYIEHNPTVGPVKVFEI